MQKHSKWLDGAIKYCVAAIILTVPLYPKFPFLRIPGTFVSIRLEDLLIAFGALLLLIEVLPRLASFLKDKLNQSVILFLVIGLLSICSAIFVTKTVSPHIGFLHWARRVEYFVPLFLGLIAIRKNRDNLGFYFKIILIVVFFAFLYGVGQRYLNWPIIITQNEEYSKGVALRWISGSHINSTFAGHYDLATYLVLVLPIVVSGAFLLKNMKIKAIMVIIFLLGLWLLVVSASRVSLISYLIAVSGTLVLIKKTKAIPAILVISILFTGFSPNLMARYKRVTDVVINKIKEVELLNYNFSPDVAFASNDDEALFKREELVPTPKPPVIFEDRSTNIRFNVEWPRAIRALSKNPLLGTGYSSITLATDNDYLRLLGEVGLLGFFAFFLILIRIGQKLLSVFPFEKFKGVELAFITGLTGSIPGLLLNAVFIDIFEASKFATIFWLLIGLGLGLVKYEKNEGKN